LFLAFFAKAGYQIELRIVNLNAVIEIVC